MVTDLADSDVLEPLDGGVAGSVQFPGGGHVDWVEHSLDFNRDTHPVDPVAKVVRALPALPVPWLDRHPESCLDAAAARRVFHSEADLQHAFAWEVHRLDPLMQVRLETHPHPRARLDLQLSRPDHGRHTAIELKYLTAGWTGEVDGEHFELTNHGAQDVRAYDVVKDIGRIEQFVGDKSGWNGAVIVLANGPNYWGPPTHGRETNAHQFRIHDGNVLEGSRTWGPLTGAGTKLGRETDLSLRRTYRCQWRDFVRLTGPRGLFRLLIFEIPGTD